MSNEQTYGLPTARRKPLNKRLAALYIAGVFLLSGEAITLYLAHTFNYQAALGSRYGYTPWAWIGWYQDYSEVYPRAFQIGISLGVILVGVLLGGFSLARSLSNPEKKKHQDLHGSARWATPKEVKEMGLMAEEGVYVGAFKDPKTGKVTYLRHNGPEHILAFAPTRSGKGVGLVLPTLLGWKESAFILDIKGENYALTSGWRSKYANNRCIRFDPSNPDPALCDGYNPLEEIRIGTQFEVGDAQNLALMVVDPLGKGLNDHWSKTAFALLTGVILYEVINAKELGEVANFTKLAYRLSDPERPSEELWEEMCDHANPIVAASGRDMLDRPEDERGSVLSTAKSFLSLYVDPVVSRNTSKSSFKIRDLMNSDKPLSLYLVINPADKGRLVPLIRIVLAQTIRTLVEKMEFKDGRSVKHYKHRLLLMLDEFASLGKIEILEEALHYMAGYGLKGYLIAQDMEQIKSQERGYGREETVSSGCHIKNAFAPTKQETAEYLSKLCGDTTVSKEALTTSGKRTGVFLGNVSRTTQQTRRPLLTPDECRRLPAALKDAKGDVIEPGDMLIAVAGFPVIYGKQILYFKDAVFSERAKVSPAAEAPIYDENQETQPATAPVAAEPVKPVAEEHSPDPVPDSENETDSPEPLKEESIENAVIQDLDF